MRDFGWVFTAILVLAIPFVVYGGNNQLGESDVVQLIPYNATSVALPVSGTVTCGTTAGTRTFKSLRKTVNQTVAVQSTGASPNYKVEVLVSLDGVNFAKPEQGGDLGTFTDANLHIIALGVPLSLEHALKFTELSGSNAGNITASELSQ